MTQPKDTVEEGLQKFLEVLDKNVFVKSTNSVTGEVESLNPAVEDREGTIYISGEWDREDFLKALHATEARVRKEILTKDIEELGVGERPRTFRRGDNPCGDCGTKTNQPVWYTDNVFWNAVMGGEEVRGNEKGAIICPQCFMERAEKKFAVQGWRIIPDWRWDELKERLQALTPKQ